MTSLEVDAEREVFVGQHAQAANAFLKREYPAPYIVPEFAGEHFALLARNPYSHDFCDRVAFLPRDVFRFGAVAGFGLRVRDALTSAKLLDRVVHPLAVDARAFEQAGGSGKPRVGQVEVCWATDEAAARRTVHEWWPNTALGGEISQILPTPVHFEQAVETVLVPPQKSRRVT